MRKINLLFLALLLGGCVFTSTDPFYFNYTPIAAANVNSPEEALKKVIKMLEDDEYKVAPNIVFLTVITQPKDIGYQFALPPLTNPPLEFDFALFCGRQHTPRESGLRASCAA